MSGYFRQKNSWFLFISDTVLQNTASSTVIFSLQPAEINQYHSAWCTQQLSRFYFLCFHFPCFWQDGRGREAQRNPSFSALLFSFFPSMVYCHVLFHKGFCSAARNLRELYKNLTVLSFLDAYTQNQIQSKELFCRFVDQIYCNTTHSAHC